MPDTSAILGLPLIQPAQAQKHVTHNEALRLLDVLVQLVVATRDMPAPPASPVEGECHIVGPGATGPWAGRSGAVAVATSGQWQFLAAKPGWRAHVLAEGATVTYLAGSWQASGAVSAPRFGINATADTTNRLTVSSAATLLTHAGAGHQVKINKAAVGDTASLLFQTNFSGRAEMGLAGNDGFGVKVSADGATWFTALAVDPANGRVTLPNAETGSNANGSWTKLPDGTLTCVSQTFSGTIATAKGSIFQSAGFTWTFPTAFVAVPRVFPGGSDNVGVVGVNAGQATLTQAQAVMWSWASSGARTFSLVALGRWF